MWIGFNKPRWALGKLIRGKGKAEKALQDLALAAVVQATSKTGIETLRKPRS